MTTIIGGYYGVVCVFYAVFAVLYALRIAWAMSFGVSAFPVMASMNLEPSDQSRRLGGVSALAAALSFGLWFGVWPAMVAGIGIACYELYLSATFYRKSGELKTVMGITRVAWNAVMAVSLSVSLVSG